MSRYRNCCFTSFEVSPPTWDHTKMGYMIYGKEIGKKTKLDHWQGYVELRTQMGIKAIKQLLGATVHVEKRMGTAQQAANYCKKDGQFTEFGTITAQGKRNDLERVVELVENGANLLDIANECPQQMIKYSKGIANMLAIKSTVEAQKKTRTINVHVLYGPSGTGKTTHAFNTGLQDPAGCYLIHANRMKWMDGYTGENTLIIDEMSHSAGVKLEDLLGLLDIYPHRLEVKGGTVWANWTEVWITSNQHPVDWFPGMKTVHKEALLRRLTNITELKRFTPSNVLDQKCSGVILCPEPPKVSRID